MFLDVLRFGRKIDLLDEFVDQCVVNILEEWKPRVVLNELITDENAELRRQNRLLYKKLDINPQALENNPEF